MVKYGSADDQKYGQGITFAGCVDAGIKVGETEEANRRCEKEKKSSKNQDDGADIMKW